VKMLALPESFFQGPMALRIRVAQIKVQTRAGSSVDIRIGTGSQRVGQITAKALRGRRYELEGQGGCGRGDVGAACNAETHRPCHNPLEIANLVDLQEPRAARDAPTLTPSKSDPLLRARQPRLRR
jgi:hypothetical protein